MITDRWVRIVDLGGNAVAEGRVIAEGLSGVLVREGSGVQQWWPAAWAALADAGTDVRSDG